MTEALYAEFIPAPLLQALSAAAEPVPGVPGLRIAPGLQAEFPEIENTEALALVCAVYRALRPKLAGLLAQRRIDRAFCDAVTLQCRAENAGLGVEDANYHTVIGRRDGAGRVVVGPKGEPTPPQRVEIPEFLRGEQVTLFGPPDTARMSINAMNALHRRRPDEPPIVAALVDESGQVARWGADNEDSKTPLMANFLRACQNLVGCFDRTLRYADPARDRVYQLADSRLSLPIKRIPGLALPDGSHILDGEPLPLHLYDLVQHVWQSRARPEALIFYVPKLENEEEAAYLRSLISATEAAVKASFPAYMLGSVRVLVVFENPRAIFRIREMARALGPHFLGGSLGWHDFLASTARLFRHDPNYRIPVKADPDIVINHIRESHDILVRSLSPIGAMKIGGMYGVLFEEGDPDSYRVSMIGFVRDVVTQLKRGLDGFWVAHPDFVRVGIALVAAWRKRERDPADGSLESLVRALVPDDNGRLLAFVFGPDVPGLREDDPRYLRGVLAADLALSPVIANHDPEEVRYNVFQAVQYLADWLCGNGCVALPATLRDADGNKVFVRIMDDLATTERSRWELWAEVQHGRVPVEVFDRILSEELDFIRADQDAATKRVAVRWSGEAARWYPVAAEILRQLVVSAKPPEFVTELTLPFTFGPIRDAADPWAAAKRLCPGRFS